ncbi:MAG: exo-alpha-sialidase [Planctomycetia bacterium]|nr:exo-alpha-sialidase [Planctomycetia bacterium]OQZ06951.1 MAG: hypothetical protein B6D36_02395 [Planctomycetes bacterium UTPLA1]
MSSNRLFLPLLAVLSIFSTRSMADFPTIFPDPIALNSNAVGDSGSDHIPHIATDGQGHWVAIWESNDTLGGTIGMDSDILFARSENNGASWTTPEPLNINAASDSLGEDTQAAIFTDSLGTWIVVWRSTTNLGGAIGTDADILYARSTNNGATWSLPAPLNTNAAIDAVSDSSPQISTDSQGHWVAVWRSQINMTGPGSDTDIFVATSNNAGVTWTPPVPLNTNATTDTGSDEDPVIGNDGQGNWLVVWRSNENLGGVIGADNDFFFARSTDNGASWTPPAVLNTNAATDTDGGGDLTIAADGQGVWLVAWTSSENLGGVTGTEGDIQFTRSTDNGATWTDPMPLNNNAAGDLGADEIPHLSTDKMGSWIAVWDGDNAAGGTVGAEYDIFIAHSADNGATWTNPVPLNANANTDTGDDYFAWTAADGRGNWVIAWESNENVGGAIGTDFDMLTTRFAFPDCNANGIGDGQDIADAASADCNTNGIPDECETDSDGDGVIDACAAVIAPPLLPNAACGACAPGVLPAVGLALAIGLISRARRR